MVVPFLSAQSQLNSYSIPTFLNPEETERLLVLGFEVEARPKRQPSPYGGAAGIWSGSGHDAYNTFRLSIERRCGIELKD